jgi:hypothetical protein
MKISRSVLLLTALCLTFLASDVMAGKTGSVRVDKMSGTKVAAIKCTVDCDGDGGTPDGQTTAPSIEYCLGYCEGICGTPCEVAN